MTIWAIVPVKPLRRGKSRLAGVFSEEERTDLNRRLLENTISTLKNIPEIEHVLVVSRDQAALALARDLGARTVLENGDSHLNVALERATIVAQTYETRGVLILPADLPLITSEDVSMMLERAADPPVVVVAPDRRKEGTNALLVCPAGLIEYHYGKDSFEKHCELARRAGARLEVCELPSLTLDLDVPDDLMLLEESLQLS
ncbi:MAG: 2-phospho-L-lactate guanylyltransferase [Chloroflexi bacterium]|nr:2-phospho-L-lactate guanylyltransferase [Chloroflexota bacterium]